MKEIFFLFSIILHFQCSRASEIEQDDIIGMIISYEHSWIGYKDCLRVWNFFNSYIGVENEHKPLPKEFRGRKYLLLFYNDKIDMLKGYLSLQNETEMIKEIFDLLEEHCRILLSDESLWEVVKDLSAREIYDKAILKYRDYSLNPEDTAAINRVISSLAVWQERIRDEPCGSILEIFYIYNLSIISLSPIENFFYYCSELKYAQLFATFELKERGGKRILQAQLNARINKFIDARMITTKEDYYQMVAAHIILRQNTKHYYLPDYIRKFFVDRAIKLASKKDLPIEKRQVYIDDLEDSRRLYNAYFKSDRSQETAPSALKKQCEKLLNGVIRYNYDEELFSLFHQLCLETHPELFKGLYSLI
jgi:hypothetical protein